MAGITPTPAFPDDTTSFMSGVKNLAYLKSDVTPLMMEYNQTTLKEMMTNYSDCFEFSNTTNLGTMSEDSNNTLLVSIHPLNNTNCSLFNGNTTYLADTINNTSQCNPNQEYFSWSYALVGTLFQSIILVVGVLGNVLTCTVVQRTRSMHTTTNCYLGSLIKDYDVNLKHANEELKALFGIKKVVFTYIFIGNLYFSELIRG